MQWVDAWEGEVNFPTGRSSNEQATNIAGGEAPPDQAQDTPVFNFSCRKVGGLRFVKLGRFTFCFCLSREYRAL